MKILSLFVNVLRRAGDRLAAAVASFAAAPRTPGASERGNATASGADTATSYRVLALASAPGDRVQLRDFCAQLGWTIMFRDKFAGWRGARREMVSVIVAMADSLSDPAIEALRRASANPEVDGLRPPVIYVAPMGATVEDVRAVGAFFEHVEMRPLFFSTFKLLVVRATAGQFSRWPALPGASVGRFRPGGDDTGGR